MKSVYTKVEHELTLWVERTSDVTIEGGVDLMARSAIVLTGNRTQFFIDVCGEKTPTAEFDEAACPCGRGASTAENFEPSY